MTVRFWRITVDVPEPLTRERRDALLGLVSAACDAWTETPELVPFVAASPAELCCPDVREQLARTENCLCCRPPRDDVCARCGGEAPGARWRRLDVCSKCDREIQDQVAAERLAEMEGR